MMSLFASVDDENSELNPRMQQGGDPVMKRIRRRRRKARADVEGGGSSGESKKRKLSDEQVKFLELNFGKEKKLESGRKMHLATELGLDPKQVAVWFQNRRARWKNKQLEEEYMKLKSEHDVTVVHKCHLENEILKLKASLSEAEEKIKSFSIGGGGGGGGGGGEGRSSSSSSTEVETYNSQPYDPYVDMGGAFGDNDDLMYIAQLGFNQYSSSMAYNYFFGM